MAWHFGERGDEGWFEVRWIGGPPGGSPWPGNFAVPGALALRRFYPARRTISRNTFCLCSTSVRCGAAGVVCVNIGRFSPQLQRGEG